MADVVLIEIWSNVSKLVFRSLTVFRPKAHVPRSVVRSLAPKPKNLDFGQLSDWLSGGLVPVQGCACTGTEPRTRKPEPRFAFSQVLYRHRACTGTVPQDRAPEPRIWIFAALVPVQDPVYRYKEADFVQFVLQGLICDCGTLITAPTPHRASFVLEPEEEQGSLPTSRHSGVSLRDLCSLVRYREAYGAEWDRHIPRVGMSGYHRHLGGTSWTTLEPSTQGEARDRGKAHVLEAVPVELREDLSFEEQPVKILAREVKKLRNRDIPYVKVLWSNHGEREAMWELESALQEHYPHLFQMEA
uniref:Chromo domain-containing protein n=1 Tax=Ananas comosus var. bracteatus TaxID=296719 RepID=A0A6V7PV88_ANACO|nr:unnamed protein product [Ananas comosus var. bracteatus]